MAALFVALVSLLMLSASTTVVVEGKADDSKCPADLEQLLPCLDYVQGKADFPSKTCCANLLVVHLNEPVCLCELIAASVDGNSQLPPMNTTLSLQLGPVCDVKTKPSICPGLLGISPSSPEAKIFESANATAAPAPTTTTPTSSGTGSSSSSDSTASSTKNGSASLSTGLVGSFIATVAMLLAGLSM